MATRLGLEKWYPEALQSFGVYTIFDLLIKYIKDGRIKLDKTKHRKLATYHDPCNYGRKSEMVFGHGYYEEPRWIIEQCSDNWVESYPNRATQFCCGAGGGVWITPYKEERLYHGRKKAEQIKATGAELLVVSCHTCYDQFKKSLRNKYDIQDLEVKYLWAMVADAIILDSNRRKVP
jgi:Fe-S oxidoreductase